MINFELKNMKEIIQKFYNYYQNNQKFQNLINNN